MTRNELSDYTLYSLGLRDQSELKEQFDQLMRGVAIETEDLEFSYEELMNMRFRMLLNTDVYTRSGTLWTDSSGDAEYMARKLEDAMELKIVGIVKPAKSGLTSESGGIGYRTELVDYLLAQVRDSEIAREQLSNPETDVFTGQPFSAVAQDALSLLDSMEVEDFMEMLESRGLIPSGMIPKAGCLFGYAPGFCTGSRRSRRHDCCRSPGAGKITVVLNSVRVVHSACAGAAAQKRDRHDKGNKNRRKQRKAAIFFLPRMVVLISK